MSNKKPFWSGLIVLLVSAFLFSKALASSGVYIEQEIQTKLDGKIESSEQVNVWIAGDFIRIDSSLKPNYTVFDSKRAIMRIIDPKNKVYMEFPFETDMTKSTKAQEQEVLREFKKTGNTKKIGRWDCFEVEVMTELKDPKGKEPIKLKAGRTFLWLTESNELKDERIKNAFVQSSFWGSEFGKSLKSNSQALIDGLPVQIVTIVEVESFGKKVVKETEITIKEIKITDVDATTFQVPDGYRKLGGAQ